MHYLNKTLLLESFNSPQLEIVVLYMPVVISRSKTTIDEIPIVIPTAREWSDPYEYIQVCHPHYPFSNLIRHSINDMDQTMAVSV